MVIPVYVSEGFMMASCTSARFKMHEMLTLMLHFSIHQNDTARGSPTKPTLASWLSLGDSSEQWELIVYFWLLCSNSGYWPRSNLWVASAVVSFADIIRQWLFCWCSLFPQHLIFVWLQFYKLRCMSDDYWTTQSSVSLVLVLRAEGSAVQWHFWITYQQEIQMGI